MSLSLSDFLHLARFTLSNPREGAKRIMALDLPRDVLWSALALMVVVSTILTHAGALVMPSTDALMVQYLYSPLLTGMVQAGLLVIMVFSVFWIGRAMGGTGRFQDVLVLVIWLQFIMVCVQVFQTVVVLVSPAIAALIGVASVALFFWLLTQFTAVVHGFQSLVTVFVMILASAFGVIFGLSMILAIISIAVPGGG